jgi:hypothetical protein
MSGEWKRGTVRLLRHRRTKGPGTGPSLDHRATPRLYPFPTGCSGTAEPDSRRSGTFLNREREADSPDASDAFSHVIVTLRPSRRKVSGTLVTRMPDRRITWCPATPYPPGGAGLDMASCRSGPDPFPRSIGPTRGLVEAGPRPAARSRDDGRFAVTRGLRPSGSLTGQGFAQGPERRPQQDDVVQDSLVRILDRLPQFEGRSRFLTWATSSPSVSP